MNIPLTVSGLQLWVDASDPNTYTLSGSKITQLNDKSGLSNNTTGYYGTQPTFQTNIINNLPVFNMAFGGFVGNFSSTNTGTTLSLFMIVSFTTFVNFGRVIALGDNTITNDSATVSKMNITSRTDSLPSLNRNSSSLVYNSTLTLNTPYLLTGYFDGTNRYLGVNGIYVSNGSTGNFNINKYAIGMNSNINTEFGNYKYGEVLVFNNALSTSDRQLIEGYLAWKWGLNASLPTNHPYYNYADWLVCTPTSNKFSSSYIQGFTDISGSVIVRNKNLIITNGDLSYLSSTTTNVLPTYQNGNVIAYDISCNNNILVNGNANINSLNVTNSLTSNTFTSTATTVYINGNMVVRNDVSFNVNNMIINNMTVGILKPSSNGIATSCGAGYNIANTALSNTSSNLQNNVIIGGNVAPFISDINYSTLIGSNILYNNTSIINNVTAIGAFSAANPGDKTNSTYIGAFAGSTITNPLTIYNQTNNTFIGGNTFAGNDADGQTSIGFGCTKNVASPNIMYVGTTAETVYLPNNLNIGPIPGNLGSLNVDGSGLFLGTGTVNVNDLSLNLNGATYNPFNFSVSTLINQIQTNNSTFIINANYVGNWIVGDYFGMMGGVKSDASSVIYMPTCYIIGARANSSNTVSGTNIYLSVLNNGIDAGDSTNQITFNTTDSSLNTFAGSTTGFGLQFNAADQLSVRYSTVSGGSIISSGGGTQQINVTLYCGYSVPVIPVLPMVILNTLTTTGYNSCRGAYGSRLLNGNYLGPVMYLRASTGQLNDFYSDQSGNLFNSSGTSLVNWLTSLGAITTYAFINKLYDQSVTYSNDGIQTTPSLQPIYDIVNKIINFGYNGDSGGINSPNSSNLCSFILPNGTVPFGNSSYTVTMKHRYTNNPTNGGWLGSGERSNNQSNNFRFYSNTAYNNYWWGNDFINGSWAVNNVVTFKYDNATTVTTLYQNSSSISTLSRSTPRSSQPTNNTIGSSIGVTSFEYLRGELYYLYIFSLPLSDSDRTIIENTTFT